MKKKKKKYKVFLYLMCIIFIFVLFYFFINDKNKNNFLTNIVKDLTGSISNVTSFSFNENNDYSKDLIKELNKDYKKEIENLKKALELNSLNSDKEFINATVIKRSTNYWYNIITIDKGKKDGIQKGYAVINNNGLIGKIIYTNNNTSDIKLLTSFDSENYISAMFNYENNTYYGLISKYDYKNDEIILENVIGDFNKEKIKDIDVVTSGLSDSFTSGLLIGKIKNINKDNFGISNTIIIYPTVNYNNLDVVTVIKGDK